MLTSAALDAFAREYYLAEDIPDHRIENQAQRDAASRILAHVPSGRVLELGYGDGLMTAALQKAGMQAELLEGSALLCGQARAQHPDLPVHHVLFESFTPKHLYDAVLALHVLEHLDDPIAVLRRMASWLLPGGTAVLVVPNRTSLHRRLALRMGLIGSLDELSDRDRLVGHQRVYDLDRLQADAAAAGLDVTGQFGSFLKLLPNSMMLSFSGSLLTALDGISDEMPPAMLANIGLVARRPANTST